MSDDGKNKKLADIWLAAGFGVVLLILTLCSLSRFDGVTLVKLFPDLNTKVSFMTSLKKLRNFTKQAEVTFESDFGGRDLLVAANMAVKAKLFQDDRGPDVLVGTDGWLYSGAGNMVDNVLGFTPYDSVALKAWQGELERRRDSLAAQGIDFLFVVAPNKETVYPEHLPGWLKKFTKPTTRLDQFVGFMRTNSTVQVLDLQSVEREAARHGPVYFATDTHWNLMGSFVASEAIAAAISNHIPGFQPLNQEDFHIERRRGPGMNLAKMCGALDCAENNLFAFTPTPQLPKLDFFGPKTNVIDCSGIGLEQIVYIEALTTRNNQRTGRVVVFGDSFTLALLPFLGQHYGRVDFYWTGGTVPKLIGKEKPVLVISEMVERNLNRVIGQPAVER